MKKNIFAKHVINVLVTIVTLLSVIFGAYTIAGKCCEVARTGLSLLILNGNISSYNSLEVKTDEATEEVSKDFEARQELYNAEDPIVRAFCRLPTIAKAIAWVAAIVAVPMVPAVTVMNVFLNVLKALREKAARKRQAR